MALTVRQIRLRGVWLLIPPFFYFARSTPMWLAIGGGLIAIGLATRAWAAGVIHKDRVLSTTGPYAFTRNPLYLGTFFLGLGAAVASGQPIYVGVFLVLFVWIYGATMRDEASKLEEQFGDDYRAFAKAVPLFVPRLTPWKSEAAKSAGFDGAQWKKNREYEALMGAVAVLVILWARMTFFSV